MTDQWVLYSKIKACKAQGYKYKEKLYMNIGRIQNIHIPIRILNANWKFVRERAKASKWKNVKIKQKNKSPLQRRKIISERKQLPSLWISLAKRLLTPPRGGKSATLLLKSNHNADRI